MRFFFLQCLHTPNFFRYFVQHLQSLRRNLLVETVATIGTVLLRTLVHGAAVITAPTDITPFVEILNSVSFLGNVIKYTYTVLLSFTTYEISCLMSLCLKSSHVTGLQKCFIQKGSSRAKFPIIQGRIKAYVLMLPIRNYSVGSINL